MLIKLLINLKPEMIKQKIEELKIDINKSKKVNVEVTVGDEEVKKKNPKN